jgi:hypothetical protein
MAPFHRVDGRLRVRPPLAGLSRLDVRPGTLALLYVALGAVIFDGFTRTTFWSDLTVDRVGWGFTAINTLGLLWSVGMVALVHLTITRVVANVVGQDAEETARRSAPVLVPILAAFTFAHDFSVLVLEGQGFWFLLSDPYGEGWDLFGTADGTLDLGWISPTAIAWVQAVAIALGTMAAVLVARDRAITDHPPRAAVLAQYWLLPMIVGAAVAAVALLIGT